jgi:hypothetical protein
VSEWQTMETAPKGDDAKWVLLYAPLGGVFKGIWNDGLPEDEHGPCIPGGWEAAGGWGAVEPTHWMPLPEPPDAT